jgi:hypothetical protein
VCDVRLLKVTIYQNGGSNSGTFQSLNEISSWCQQKIPQGTSIVLIGSKRQAEKLFRDLEYYNFNVCSYGVEQTEPERQTNNQEPSISEVLASLNEVKALLKKEQPKSANYALFNNSFPQRETKDIKELKSFLAESLESLSKKQSETQYLVYEIYNYRESGASSNGSSEIIADLRKELTAYKNDFYQKSMLNFGVNTAIEILDRLYTEKNLLKQKGVATDEQNRLEQIISFCETKMKKLNLKVSHSTDGDEFDGSRMITYDDKVSTDNEDLKGRVAYSISPAIYWTLPRVNAPGGDELLIKEETVALYE